MAKWIHVGALILTVGLLCGCPNEPVAHRPVTEIGPQGDAESLVLAGRLEDLGPCEILYPDDAPDGFERVSVNLVDPETVDEWIRLALESGFLVLRSDPWGSWLQLGELDPLPDLGVELRGRRTGSTDICAGERIPRFVIDEMIALYDLDEESSFLTPVEVYFGGRPYEPDDEDVRVLLEAGLAALQGQQRELTIEVEGTYGEDCSCPAWRLEEPEVGYVSLSFADSDLAPNDQAVLASLLAEEGLSRLDELEPEDAEDMIEEAREITWTAEHIYTGFFTGEVTFELNSDTAAAAPVFMVTGVVEDD